MKKYTVLTRIFSFVLCISMLSALPSSSPRAAEIDSDIEMDGGNKKGKKVKSAKIPFPFRRNHMAPVYSGKAKKLNKKARKFRRKKKFKGPSKSNKKFRPQWD